MRFHNDLGIPESQTHAVMFTEKTELRNRMNNREIQFIFLQATDHRIHQHLKQTHVLGLYSASATV